MKYTFVDTCFNTHHLQFDANDVLWASTGGASSPVIGWLDMKIFDETGDAAKAQGWTPLDPRHQRQRQARRIRGAQSAGGPDERQTYRGRILCRDAEPGRRLRLGCRTDFPWLDRAHRSGVESLGDGARGDLQYPAAWLRYPRRRHRQARRRLGVARERPSWRVSIEENAKGRSMDRRRRAITAPRAGRSTNIPVLAFRASARTAPSRAITPGWTSTTRSDSAKTCRCPPATYTTA